MRVERIHIPLEPSGEEETLALCGRKYIFSSSDGPRVLITGALHGDEPTAAAALWYLAERIAGTSLSGSVTIIPCVNVLSLAASSRLIPHEDTDVNRCFGGRKDGSLAERLAAALVGLLVEHDALIDVHTAGWCTPFVLLDHSPDIALAGYIARWARTVSLPVVTEMPAEQSSLQGLDRSWTASAITRFAKPAFTLELNGYRTIDGKCAKQAADWLMDYLRAAASLGTTSDKYTNLPFRTEVYVNANGLFEAFCQPGDAVNAGETLGVVRAFDGVIKETVVAARSGLILAIQPISAIHVGSWIVTLAVCGGEDMQCETHVMREL